MSAGSIAALTLRRHIAQLRLDVALAEMDLLRAHLAALGPARAEGECQFSDETCARGLCRVCGPRRPPGDISLPADRTYVPSLR